MPRAWANAILKFNRSQLKKRNIRELKDLLHEAPRKTVTKFKEVNPSELKRIKKNIQQKAREHDKREIVLYTIALLVSVFLLWLIKKML